MFRQSELKVMCSRLIHISSAIIEVLIGGKFRSWEYIKSLKLHIK